MIRSFMLAFAFLMLCASSGLVLAEDTREKRFKLEFLPASVVMSMEAGSLQTLEELGRLIHRTRQQRHWHFVLTGFAPSSCIDRQCAEARLLQLRAEHVSARLMSLSRPDGRLRWRTDPSINVDVVQIALESQPVPESPCKGLVRIVDPVLPDASAAHDLDGYRLSWNSELPVSPRALILVDALAGQEAALIAADGVPRSLEESKLRALQGMELPATLVVLPVARGRALGPMLHDWDGRVAPERPQSGSCAIRFEAW